MSARKKLNTVFLFIATGTAAFFGLMSDSVLVFIICLIVLVAALIDGGSIRLKPKGRRR